jgi:UDP-2-acetamido-3-amino-2,3-dideoxy-glucuronate N-acetyltransferase
VLVAGKPAPSVGLIGYGQWGRNLARNLAALGALRVVCDGDASARETARRHHPAALSAPDPAAVLADPSIDAVVVATPAVAHVALARQALEAGKDVFVEKPLALTVDDGHALVELAQARGRVLMVGHVLEFHPAVERLRELVARGDLGRLRYIYSNRLNLGRIRTEENALWSFAPHDIHVILRLLGELPVDAACRGGSYLQQTVADVTMSALSFASGVRAHIFVSWLHPYKEQKLVVVGDRKMAVFDDTLAAGKLQLYPHRVDWVDRMPVAVKSEAEIVDVDDEEPLAREIRHFLECVVSRTPPRTDGASGVDVLRVLDACQRSLERGGVPVRLGTVPADVFVHETATVDPGASIGAGTKVWHYGHVMPGARIGRGCSLGQNVFVANDVVIGDNVKIQNNVSVYEGVTLEDDVFCGPSMVFTNVLTPRSHVSRRHEFLRTRVGKGATIGANATVVCGHDLGRYAFVGAGAVVTTDVPPHALVLGNPARVAGWMCECGVRLALRVDAGTERGSCAKCGAAYERQGQDLRRAEQRA